MIPGGFHCCFVSLVRLIHLWASWDIHSMGQIVLKYLPNPSRLSSFMSKWMLLNCQEMLPFAPWVSYAASGHEMFKAEDVLRYENAMLWNSIIKNGSEVENSQQLTVVVAQHFSTNYLLMSYLMNKVQRAWGSVNQAALGASTKWRLAPCDLDMQGKPWLEMSESNRPYLLSRGKFGPQAGHKEVEHTKTSPLASFWLSLPPKVLHCTYIHGLTGLPSTPSKRRQPWKRNWFCRRFMIPPHAVFIVNDTYSMHVLNGVESTACITIFTWFLNCTAVD